MPLKQEAAPFPMCTVDIIAHDGSGHVVAVLRGKLDVVYATLIAARLSAIAASQRDIIIDLTRVIDSFSVCADVRAAADRARQSRPVVASAPAALAAAP